MNRNTPGRKGSARPTIGMLTCSMVDLYQLQWLGVVDAARAHQANLICFPGKELRHPHDFDAQANVLYDLVSPQLLDGLIIWTASLQLFVGQQQIEAFCQRYQPLPIVSVEQLLPGQPSLLVDNKGGMYQAVSHLIEVHGYRRIAFLRGPENHLGAQERYQGYLEALAQHRLPLDPTLVSPHPSSWEPAEAAATVKMLLDAQPDVEAIAAANDDLALGVLSVLHDRDIRVPDDVAVVGFDNSLNIIHHDLGLESISRDAIEADVARSVNIRATTPPLTTVRAPFYELGWQAVEILLAQIGGEVVPNVVTVPTELLVRRSCGCFSQAVLALEPGPIVQVPHERSSAEDFQQAMAAQQPQLADQLRQVLRLPTATLGPDWAERLVTAFIREVQREAPNAFLLVLDELLRASVTTGESLERWWQALFVLRRHSLPYLATGEALSQAEDLWQRVQVHMEELAKRFSLHQQLLVEKRNQIVREIGQKLVTTLDIDQLAKILAQELPKLGIQSCYAALYVPQPNDSSPRYPTEWSRSILVYEYGQQIELAGDEALFPSRQLVPGARLNRKKPYSMVVEALYFKEQQLGFVLFEVGLREGWVYETLQGQLSSALQGALLVEREKRALAAVEEAKYHVEIALEERARLLAQTQEQNRLLHQEINQRQQVEAALQRAQAELEQRVAARTAELAQANAILTEQIGERLRAEEMQAKLEAQLRQAQKMEAIGQLAGGIAHDFNNLLVVINGYSDLLLSALEDTSPMRKDVEQIQQAGERAATLTRQLLAFSRQQVLQPRVLNLNRVVISVETMLRRLIGEDIILATALAPALAPVIADPGQIEQIIVNLAVNARDAMPHGGQLTIATANVALDTDAVRDIVGLPAGPYVTLQVRDTGMGMDAQTQAHLFEPFFTTKPQGQGTGLGLATVFGIVQQSGGHIAVASAVGQGTTFTIYLPQAMQPLDESVPFWLPAHSSLIGTETILVVEDDPGVRGATRRFLEGYGYTVLEASHGQEALQICQADHTPIHLLITDVVMPTMSGRELAKRVAHLRPALPVLYVSGYTDSAIIRHGLAEATISLLQKPFTAETLAQKVRELLDRKRGT